MPLCGDDNRQVSVTFVDKIKACHSPFYFAEAIDVAAGEIRPDLRRSAFRRVGGGVEVLESEARLNDYLVAYGEMHMAKVFASLPAIHWKEINNLLIVDWGCGQGLASAVTLEYLRTNHSSIRIKGVRLIEKSRAARSRAQVIVSQYDNAVSVRSYDWNLEMLSIEELDIPKGVTILHLFSNILDVVCAEQDKLAELVQAMSLNRDCHIVCVGPKGCSYSPIRSFYGLFPKSTLRLVNDYCIAVRGKYYPYEWCSCYGICFSLSAATSAPPLPEVHYYVEDLMAFTAANRPESVVAAIRYGVDVDSIDADGSTALMLAAKFGAIEALRVLINHNADIEHRNGKGASSLYFAAKYGEVECVRALLAAGADVECRILSSGLTPYLVAAKYGNTKCMELLADAGCNLKVCDSRGRDASLLRDCFAREGKMR